MPDPYEIIGVRRDASLDEIRIAYRRSAQVLHPDRFATSSDGVRSEAARRMLQLNSAMEAIESERADEASGTGNLGSVSFDPAHAGHRASPVAHRRASAPAPVLGPAAAEHVERHGDTRRRRSARLASSCPARGPARRPRPRALPRARPTRHRSLPQPVASAPTRRASPRPIRRTCSSQPEPMFTPAALLLREPQARARRPSRDPSCPTRRPSPHPYALGVGDAFTADYDDDDYDDDLPSASRRSGGRSGVAQPPPHG